MIKRELLIHYLFFLGFFIFLAIKRNLFSLYSIPFWLGGIVGTFVVDLDHLLYAFLLNKNDLASQRALYYFKNRQYLKGLLILWDAKDNRTHQVFHSFSFQLIFLVLTFWVVSSSGNYLAIGLVLAFSLHLFVDQLSDLLESGNLDLWKNGFWQVKIEGRNQLFYWIIVFSSFLLLSFLF
ncbi:MAG: hypothetical protein KatS3mg088_033 [Patescibacteria group bacterium]|nr:MAG: hypothetical protein KatS3mg088_033 [Patescibacteria group bacterium]